MQTQGWDIIGDIHGHGRELEALLHKLGYEQDENIPFNYSHPDKRKVIFLGDLIDRGDQQWKVVHIAKAMCENNNAEAILGNHELNAIGFFLQDENGKYLRERNNVHTSQHRAFLNEFAFDLKGENPWQKTIEWFITLPLWIEKDGLRCVHACWEQKQINLLEKITMHGYLDIDLIKKAFDKKTAEHKAIEIILKGFELELPDNQFFVDGEGNKRQHIRATWWNKELNTLRETFLGPATARQHIPEMTFDTGHLPQYDENDKPLFFGHYWMCGTPALLNTNIACLDWSVIRQNEGKLVAYRWNGEQKLYDENLIWVENKQNG